MSAFIAPLAFAGGSALLGSMFGKKENSLDKSLSAGTTALGQQGKDLGTTSSSLLNPAASYWLSLLSENPAETSAALAPDIARIRGSEASVLNSASTLAPRGGGRGTTLFGTPLQAETQTQGLYNAARPAAAQAAGSLGTATAGLSQNAFAQMIQAYLQRRGQNMNMDINGPMGQMLASLASIPGAVAGKGAANLPGMGGGGGGEVTNI